LLLLEQETVLLQHLGAIRGFIAKLLPLGFCCVRNREELVGFSVPRSEPQLLVHPLDAEVVDPRIARIISDIPQRRVRRHA
jgi:hypothetical protein